MRLELRRSGGFTGTTKRWQVEAGDDPAWRSLVDNAGLDAYRGFGPIVRRLALGQVAGGHHDDFQFDLRVDGRRAKFSGVHLEGSLRDLVDRIVAEGEEIGSRPDAPNG